MIIAIFCIFFIVSYRFFLVGNFFCSHLIDKSAYSIIHVFGNSLFLLIHSFIHSSMRSIKVFSFQSFVYPLVIKMSLLGPCIFSFHLFNPLLIYSQIHSYILTFIFISSFTTFSVYSCIHSFITKINLSFIYSLIYQIIKSFSESFSD